MVPDPDQGWWVMAAQAHELAALLHPQRGSVSGKGVYGCKGVSRYELEVGCEWGVGVKGCARSHRGIASGRAVCVYLGGSTSRSLVLFLWPSVRGPHPRKEVGNQV